MKLKEKIKRFLTLDVHGHEGFTLVELIIVIAILAILSSVAVVGYSSYVKKANMQADRTMVSQLISAIELASYMDADKFPSDATLYLSSANAVVTGADKAKLEAILADAYGAGWAQQLKLKYTEWGLGATVATHAKKLQATLAKLGDKSLSYTDDVDALWDEVETILTGLQDASTVTSVYGNNAGLMNSAADFTLNGSSNVTEAEDFAAMWANPNDTFTGLSNIEYTGEEEKTAEALDPLLARYAAIKGRNYTFGNWLMSKSGMAVIATEIQNASTGVKAANVDVPEDCIELITNSAWGENHTPTEVQDLAIYVNEYFGTTCVEAKPTGNGGKYYLMSVGGAASTTSQAYADALGYFTLMEAVDSASTQTSGMSNEEYLNTMGAAVHNVGAMLGNDDLIDVEGGCVGITVKTDADGNIVFYITPSDIYAGGSNVQSGTDTIADNVTVTLDIDASGNLILAVSGSLKLRVNGTGSINYVASDACVEELGEDTANSYLSALRALELSSSNSAVAVSEGTSVLANSIGTTVLAATIGDMNLTISVRVVE